MDGDDLLGLLVVFVVLCLTVGVAVGLLGVLTALGALVALLLLPAFIVGFAQGVRQGLRERKAEDSNPSRASDRTG